MRRRCSHWPPESNEAFGEPGRATIRRVWERWLNSYPELRLLDLDVGRGLQESRTLHNAGPLTHLLMPHDEKVLVHCLTRLADHDAQAAAGLTIRQAERGALLPDLDLLAGAFCLAEGRLDEAVDRLAQCYQTEPEPGLAIRRMYPSLRLLLRVTPCVLLPLYPNAYGAEVMYAVALWRAGQGAEALEVLKDMVGRWGLFDELRLIGGIIHLERGNVDRAIGALTVGEITERDAMELTRSMYLAYAHFKREEFRSAGRALMPALQTVTDVNPHLRARCLLLLAELYERNGLLLNALRESGRVQPEEVPGEVAAQMLAREERWLTELALLSPVELERLARADTYQVYVPDAVQPKSVSSPLDTSRDPGRGLRPREMSWLKRQAEQREIRAYRAAVARGETITLKGERGLSAAGAEIKTRIAAAERWWPGRRQALQEARPQESLAHHDPLEVGHLRFDFCGSRRAPRKVLQGEKRARAVAGLAWASLLIFLGLWLLQTCVR